MNLSAITKGFGSKSAFRAVTSSSKDFFADGIGLMQLVIRLAYGVQ